MEEREHSRDASLEGKERPRDGFDRLAQQNRTDFRMLKDGQAVTADDELNLVSELQDFRKDHARDDGRPYSIKSLAPLVGVSHSVLSEFLSGKYRGDRAKVARLVDQFLADEREKVGRHDFRQFARIELTTKIFATIDAGIQLGQMPVVILPPGAGKSVTLRAYQLERSGVLVLRIEDEPCDKRAVTELFCDLIQELRPMKSRPHRRRLDSIKQWLRKRRNTVLLIDEAQKLSRSALELLRDLHDWSDPTGHRCIPICFAGDESFRKLLGDTKDGRATRLQPQMIRRMTPVFDAMKDCDDCGDGLGLYSVEDILRIVRNDRVRLLTQKAARWLCQLSNTGGYGLLGFALAVLRQAALLFKSHLASGGHLDIKHLQESLMMTAGKSLAAEIDSAAGGELLRKVG